MINMLLVERPYLSGQFPLIFGIFRPLTQSDAKQRSRTGLYVSARTVLWALRLRLGRFVLCDDLTRVTVGLVMYNIFLGPHRIKQRHDIDSRVRKPFRRARTV
jgi:hypothetical protein